VAKNLFPLGRTIFCPEGRGSLGHPRARALPDEGRILDIYLNSAEWGDGVFGAEMAARVHLRQSASNMSREDAARLAAILPAPRRWPVYGSVATRRAQAILERMAFAAPREGNGR
jgi:monofunctional biosynthetic peptidoglycan transglycosylase